MSVETALDDADLHAFVDGRIDPARAVAIADALASDPEARARIDSWKRQNENLRTMFASVLFEAVPIRLLPAAGTPRPSVATSAKLLDAGVAVPMGRGAGVIVTTSIGMAMVGFVLGALASLGTDGFGLSPRGGHRGSGGTEIQLVRPPADRPLAELAAEAHRTFIADATRPVELAAAEEPKLLRWLQHRLGAALRIPDLGRQGWTLVGGRIVPGVRGPAAFLVYASGADRLGLTVSRTPDLGTGGIDTVGGGEPIGVATWGDQAFGYALTSDLGADWLERNAVGLRDSIKAQVWSTAAVP